MLQARRLCFASTAAVLVCSCTSQAGVTFGSVTREVSAVAGFDPAVTLSTSGLGEWDEVAYHEYTDDYHLPGQPSWGRARQATRVGVDGAGMAYVVGEGQQGGFDGFPVGGVGAGLGVNRIVAEFILDAPSQADLYVNELPGGTMVTQFYTRIRAGSPGSMGAVIFGRSWSAGDFGARWAGAVLAPGVYTFEAYFTDGWQGSSTGGGTGRWQTSLTVPAPASGAAVALLAGVTIVRRRR